MEQLTQQVKDYAIEQGAGLAGVAPVSAWENEKMKPELMLPGAKSVIAIAVELPQGATKLKKGEPRHPRTFGTANQMCAREANRVAYRIVRFLERQGYEAVMERSYYGAPMNHETKGWVADLNLAKTGEFAGLGEVGDSNLLLTPEFGPRLWLSAVVTDAELVPNPRITDLCNHCGVCYKVCPNQALTGKGWGNIKPTTCLKTNEPEALPGVIEFMRDLVDKSPEEQKKAFYSEEFWNIWYFMVYGGLSYRCARCMRACHVGRKKKTGAASGAEDESSDSAL